MRFILTPRITNKETNEPLRWQETHRYCETPNIQRNSPASSKKRKRKSDKPKTAENVSKITPDNRFYMLTCTTPQRAENNFNFFKNRLGNQGNNEIIIEDNLIFITYQALAELDPTLKEVFHTPGAKSFAKSLSDIYGYPTLTHLQSQKCWIREAYGYAGITLNNSTILWLPDANNEYLTLYAYYEYQVLSVKNYIVDLLKKQGLSCTYNCDSHFNFVIQKTLLKELAEKNSPQEKEVETYYAIPTMQIPDNHQKSRLNYLAYLDKTKRAATKLDKKPKELETLAEIASQALLQPPFTLAFTSTNTTVTDWLQAHSPQQPAQANQPLQPPQKKPCTEATTPLYPNSPYWPFGELTSVPNILAHQSTPNRITPYVPPTNNSSLTSLKRKLS